MKKLIFVDNDDQEIAVQTVRNYVKNKLVFFGNLSQEYVDSINIVDDFWRIEREKVFEMAYNPDNAIITWSVYTRSPMADSKLQIIGVLRTAGISEVNNCTYIDLTGELPKALEQYLAQSDSKGVIHILRAIESNQIVTFINNEVMRLRVGINAKGIFSFEPTDLLRILK